MNLSRIDAGELQGKLGWAEANAGGTIFDAVAKWDSLDRVKGTATHILSESNDGVVGAIERTRQGGHRQDVARAGEVERPAGDEKLIAHTGTGHFDCKGAVIAEDDATGPGSVHAQ